MKTKLIAGLIVALSALSVLAEPGGIYTLTGDEKGLSEIIRADMAQFPDFYKGESLNSYISKFKKENRIGKRKLSPGDELRFPETLASLKLKSSVKATCAPSSNETNNTHAEVSCKNVLVRFKKGSPAFTNIDESFSKVPDKYKKAKISSCNYGNSAPLVFKVEKSGIVTLVISKKHASIFKKDGWSAVGEAERIDLPGNIFKLMIYEKYLDIGEYSYKKVQKEPFGIRVVIFQ